MHVLCVSVLYQNAFDPNLCDRLAYGPEHKTFMVSVGRVMREAGVDIKTCLADVFQKVN